MSKKLKNRPVREHCNTVYAIGWQFTWALFLFLGYFGSLSTRKGRIDETNPQISIVYRNDFLQTDFDNGSFNKGFSMPLLYRH